MQDAAGAAEEADVGRGLAAAGRARRSARRARPRRRLQRPGDRSTRDDGAGRGLAALDERRRAVDPGGGERAAVGGRAAGREREPEPAVRGVVGLERPGLAERLGEQELRVGRARARPAAREGAAVGGGATGASAATARRMSAESVFMTLIRRQRPFEVPRDLDAPRIRMDLVAGPARILLRWRPRAATSAPGCGVRRRGPRPTSRRCSAPLAPRLPRRLPRRRRRRRGGGHGAGGVPRRRPRARPLRPAPPVRAVAAPDRRQPRDRLVARASPAGRAGARRPRPPSTPSPATRPALAARSRRCRRSSGP